MGSSLILANAEEVAAEVALALDGDRTLSPRAARAAAFVSMLASRSPRVSESSSTIVEPSHARAPSPSPPPPSPPPPQTSSSTSKPKRPSEIRYDSSYDGGDDASEDTERQPSREDDGDDYETSPPQHAASRGDSSSPGGDHRAGGERRAPRKAKHLPKSNAPVPLPPDTLSGRPSPSKPPPRSRRKMDGSFERFEAGDDESNESNGGGGDGDDASASAAFERLVAADVADSSDDDASPPARASPLTSPEVSSKPPPRTRRRDTPHPGSEVSTPELTFNPGYA